MMILGQYRAVLVGTLWHWVSTVLGDTGQYGAVLVGIWVVLFGTWVVLVGTWWPAP